MKFLLVLLGGLFFQAISFAQQDMEQRTCLTGNADNRLKTKFPAYKNIIEERSQFQKYVLRNKLKENLREENDTLYIPIIVHIIHNGDATGTNENLSSQQVYSQFDVLNEDFQRRSGSLGFNINPSGASLPLKFIPALIDTNGIALQEPGINRVNGGIATWDSMEEIDASLKPRTQFDPTRYLNIWVVTFGGGMATYLGYAQYPDLSSLSGVSELNGVAKSDGLVIRFNAFGRTGNLKTRYNKGRTVTHEMGHFLGLLHIWGSGDSNPDCTDDDGCEDTPQTRGPVYGCPASTESCTAGVPAMIDNYLDYADDNCMHVFTLDQKDRILTVLAHSPRRKELASSKVSEGLKITRISSQNMTSSFEEDLVVYPNPFDEKITIEKAGRIIEAKLYSLMGTVCSVPINYLEEDTRIELETATLANGIYFLKIRNENCWITKKLVK